MHTFVKLGLTNADNVSPGLIAAIHKFPLIVCQACSCLEMHVPTDLEILRKLAPKCLLIEPALTMTILDHQQKITGSYVIDPCACPS